MKYNPFNFLLYLIVIFLGILNSNAYALINCYINESCTLTIKPQSSELVLINEVIPDKSTCSTPIYYSVTFSGQDLNLLFIREIGGFWPYVSKLSYQPTYKFLNGTNELSSNPRILVQVDHMNANKENIIKRWVDFEIYNESNECKNIMLSMKKLDSLIEIASKDT